MMTKIIATVGPKTVAPDALRELLKSGVDVVRVNFSHASFEQYQDVKKVIDSFNKTTDRQIKLLLDLQGPRIRVGQMPAAGLILRDGEIYKFAYANSAYKKGGIIPIDNADLCHDIKSGQPLYRCN
jgi:pyruvate kinase